MRQRRWLELLCDYDCVIRYASQGKQNVGGDALKPLRTIEPLRVPSLGYEIGWVLPKRILEAQIEARNQREQSIDKRATPIGSESRWSSRLETELMSRSHPAKVLYDSVSGARLNPSTSGLSKLLAKSWNLERLHSPLGTPRTSSRVEAEFHHTFHVSNPEEPPPMLRRRTIVIAVRREFHVDDKLQFVEEPLKSRTGAQTLRSALAKRLPLVISLLGL
ncbi:hypothetical protein Tco_0533905 [Tanacetum coccineum]